MRLRCWETQMNEDQTTSRVLQVNAGASVVPHVNGPGQHTHSGHVNNIPTPAHPHQITNNSGHGVIVQSTVQPQQSFMGITLNINNGKRIVI